MSKVYGHMNYLYTIMFFFIKLSDLYFFFFFSQAEDGIRDLYVTGVQTCALPISRPQYASGPITSLPWMVTRPRSTMGARSEERRVGKECRSRWSLYHEKKKKAASQLEVPALAGAMLGIGYCISATAP